MDSETKMIEIVKTLVQVVGELAEDKDLSEFARADLERAKQDVSGLQSRSDAEALE
jgi:hypothetical protein